MYRLLKLQCSRLASELDYYLILLLYIFIILEPFLWLIWRECSDFSVITVILIDSKLTTTSSSMRGWPIHLLIFDLKFHELAQIDIVSRYMQGGGRLIFILYVSSFKVFTICFDPTLDFAKKADLWIPPDCLDI